MATGARHAPAPKHVGDVPISPSVRVLLSRADGLLDVAAGADRAADRFLNAYLAAIRGAAAVLAARVRSGGRRPRSRSAWVLMAATAPELAEWADYFASHSATRAAIDAGISRRISDPDADELFAQVGRFLDLVEEMVDAGVPRLAVRDEPRDRVKLQAKSVARSTPNRPGLPAEMNV